MPKPMRRSSDRLKPQALEGHLELFFVGGEIEVEDALAGLDRVFEGSRHVTDPLLATDPDVDRVVHQPCLRPPPRLRGGEHTSPAAGKGTACRGLTAEDVSLRKLQRLRGPGSERRVLSIDRGQRGLTSASVVGFARLPFSGQIRHLFAPARASRAAR